MRYRYVFAAEILGISRPEGELEISRIASPELIVSARFARDLDTILAESDRNGAFRTLLLGGLLSTTEEGRPEERFDHAIQKQQLRRQQPPPVGAYFVFEADGEIEDFDPQPQAEFAGCVVTLGDAPTQGIRERHAASLAALMASLAMAQERVWRVKKVADTVTFVRRDGVPIHCYQMKAFGTAFGSAPPTEQLLHFVDRHWRALARHQSVVSSARLLAQSLADDNDPLLSFLSVWSGLEIFINKNFNVYQKRLFKRLADTGSTGVPTGLAARIQNVMLDKYRLSDKFSIIAQALAESEANTDQKQFDVLNEIRNKLLHGMDLDSASLPVANTSSLLRKYLTLHLESEFGSTGGARDRGPIEP